MKIKKVNLKRLMADADIEGYSELSRKTGLHRITLKKYTTVEGISDITLSKLIKLCDVLNCKMTDLIEFSESEDDE